MATLPHDDTYTANPASEEAAGSERPSTLALLRNVVLDLTQVVEDSTELIGASVREELAEFRVDMARQILSLVALVIGGALATAGLAMLVESWIHSWPMTLLLFGAIYLAFAAGIHWGRAKSDSREWK